MYQRLSIEEIKGRRPKYHKIPAFKVTYRAISWMSSTYHDIDPVEAWDEAVETMKTIAEEEHKKFAIESICYELPDKYLEFLDLEGHINKRSKDESERTALMVLFNVLFMLIMRQKEQDGHPYLEYCKWIVPVLLQNPLYEQLCQMTRTNEVNLEEEVGHELEPQDFLNAEGMPMPIIEMDETKENLNRAVMITMQFASYFHKGIDIIYIRSLWEELFKVDYLHLDSLLNGQSFNTLVCGVIGLLKGTVCTSCTYMDLAKEMTIPGMNKDSIAKYIGMKCSGSGALRKVATYMENKDKKSS